MEPMPLAGLLEICQRAGIRRPVVSMWRTRYDTFPEPVADLAVGPVFWWPEVETWLRRNGRRTDAGWTLNQVREPRQPGLVVVQPPEDGDQALR